MEITVINQIADSEAGDRLYFSDKSRRNLLREMAIPIVPTQLGTVRQAYAAALAHI